MGVLRGAPWRTKSRIGHDGASRTIHSTPRHVAHIVAGNLSSPTLMRAGQALLAQQAVSILACDAEQCQARVQDGQHSYRVTLAEQSTCECGTDNQGGCAHMALAATQRRRADRAAQSQQNRLTPGQRRALAHTSGTTLQRRTGAVAGHLAPDLSPAAQLDAAAESSVLSQQGLVSRA